MDGCRERYGDQSCDEYEEARIRMSVRQPQSMVNYTSTGFTKIKAPEKLFSLLKTHYELNRGRSLVATRTTVDITVEAYLICSYVFSFI
jgi:prolyl 4-hydroxylase